MPRRPDDKIKRRSDLQKYILKDPFATDEELAKLYSVSINTIRLDRSELGIKEVRERIKNMADNSYSKIKSLNSSDIIGEIIDITVGEKAVAVFETNVTMTFEKNNIVRGHYLYSFAETLAIAIVPENMALVGVANIKYKLPVYAMERIVGEAIVTKQRMNSYFVHIIVTNTHKEEVFRSKFILKALS